MSSWLSIVYEIKFFDLVKDVRAHLLILIFKRLSIHRFEKRAIPCRNLKCSMEFIHNFKLTFFYINAGFTAVRTDTVVVCERRRSKAKIDSVTKLSVFTSTLDECGSTKSMVRGRDNAAAGTPCRRTFRYPLRRVVAGGRIPRNYENAFESAAPPLTIKTANKIAA